MKLKCGQERPCRNCQKRGLVCISKPLKPSACEHCQIKKIRCDRQRPCENCLKAKLNCEPEYPQTPGNSVPEAFQTPPDPISTLLELGNTPRDPTADILDLGMFDFDAYSLFSWSFPTSSPELNFPDLLENHGLVFDDFDRSRLLHHLRNVPNDIVGTLPSPAQLTCITRQYFQHLALLAPWLHVPSFNVRHCPILLLLLILAVGDVFSPEKSMERWARKAFYYLLPFEIENYEKSGEELPITLVQAINMCVSELVFSGDARRIAQATRYRAVLSNASRQLQIEENNDDESIMGDDAGGWLAWINRETRRRTLMHLYLTDTSISLHLGIAPVLRPADLRIPLPCSNDVWFASTNSQWQELVELENLARRGEPRLYFNNLLSLIMNDSPALVAQCRGIMDLTAIAIALQELITMARRLSEADAGSKYLMKKSRDALDAWRTSWQSMPQRTTKPQYLALMSSWCSAELYLGAPDFVLKMVYRISTENDISRLLRQFVETANARVAHLSADQFNDILGACGAALCHVETLADFTTRDDVISTIRASIFASVVASIFLGGLCLWFSLRVIRIRGRSNPASEERVLSRLKTALASIQWKAQPTDLTEMAFTVLLGNLLEETRVWGESRLLSS